MGKSQRLRDQELRAVHRLLSDLRELRHDRPAMHRYLVDTLARLVGATCGYTGDVGGWRPEAADDASSVDLSFQSLTIGTEAAEHVARVIRALAANSNLWDDPTFEPGVRREGDVDAFSFHAVKADDPGWRARYPLFTEVTRDARHVDHLVALYQKSRGPDGRPAGDIFGVSLARYDDGELFAGRELALAQLVFEELRWLHVTGRLEPPGPDRDALPPRQRAVLELILAGLAPKQIARQLGLSVHTVRDHIRRLYERYDADGRDTLVAKFMRGVGAVAATLTPLLGGVALA